MRKPTKAEKLAFVESVVDTAIIQSAESSGLRKWLIERSMKQFSYWQHVNADEILLQMHEHLIYDFESIIDPKFAGHVSLSQLDYSDAPTPWM